MQLALCHLKYAKYQENKETKDVKELYDYWRQGYIGRQCDINLFETAGTELEVALRSNQKEQKPMMLIWKKVRKRIEVVFSQLYDQFMMQHNYVKSSLLVISLEF